MAEGDGKAVRQGYPLAKNPRGYKSFLSFGLSKIL